MGVLDVYIYLHLVQPNTSKQSDTYRHLFPFTLIQHPYSISMSSEKHACIDGKEGRIHYFD